MGTSTTRSLANAKATSHEREARSNRGPISQPLFLVMLRIIWYLLRLLNETVIGILDAV